MMEAKIINRKSWLVWLNRVLLTVAVTMIISIARGSVTMALSNVGPSSPGDRYNLTRDSTHPYTELEVPVYFKDKPDSNVGVQVFDIHRSPGDWSSGAVFNGGTRIYGDGHFTVDAGDFWYDSSTGYWKARIRAFLIGGLFQFKLRLDRSDGIIAYATGRASQASIWYNDRMGDINGHERKEMQMALPCSFTEPTHLGGPGSPYHLRLYDLDTWYPWWGTNNGQQPLSVSVYDESDNGRRVAYYDGNDPKYQCGQLGAGDDGVYGSHGCMGENGVLYVEMMMYPDHKYKIVIDNVWKNNLIEYELPFDNIFYNITCEPKVDMRTTVDFTKKPTGDSKKPRTGYKWLSSYGKYNSKENDKSIAEVMGYLGANKPNTPNTLWTWTGNYPHVKGSLPKAVMDNNHHKAELYPGDELTWWFRAYNSSGYIVPEEMKMDFTNLREGWIDPRPLGQSWNQTEPKPEEGSNWFRPADRGGPLNGSDHRQIMWGCYDWGGECYDNVLSFNRRISKGEAVTRHYRYVVKPGDAGQTLCQWLRMSWNYNGWKQRLTPKACVYIPYHYPLKPPPGGGDKDNSGVVPTARVANGKSTVQAGDDVQFSYSLTNISGPTVSRRIGYEAYAFILRKGAKLPPNYKQKPYHYAERWDSKGVGCGGRDIIPGSQGLCERGVFGASEKIYPGQTWSVPGQSTYNVSYKWLAQPGDKICSYIAIDNNWSVKNDQSADTFRASNIACVVVTKSPNLNLSGSDSYADKGFQGASVSKSDKVPGTDKRGSYSQYGLLTGGVGVTNFGSAGYTTADGNYHSLACKLSYANTDSAQVNCNDLNGLKPAGLIKPDNGKLSKPKWSTSFKSQLVSQQASIDSLPASGDYRRKGSLTITGGSLSKGQHVRLFVQGNVTISGNISVDEVNPIHNSLSDIPSLTVVATGDIRVEHGVSVIAGTYVAGGKFESCKEAQKKKTSALGVNGVCQQKLKVNGAIVSGGSPVFRRTFGAGNDSDDDQWDTKKISSTAEWINYTPNLWLTTSNGSSGNQLEGLTTTQVTNLPVRY